MLVKEVFKSRRTSRSMGAFTWLTGPDLRVEGRRSLVGCGMVLELAEKFVEKATYGNGN